MVVGGRPPQMRPAIMAAASAHQRGAARAVGCAPARVGDVAAVVIGPFCAGEGVFPVGRVVAGQQAVPHEPGGGPFGGVHQQHEVDRAVSSTLAVVADDVHVADPRCSHAEQRRANLSPAGVAIGAAEPDGQVLVVVECEEQHLAIAGGHHVDALNAPGVGAREVLRHELGVDFDGHVGMERGGVAVATCRCGVSRPKPNVGINVCFLMTYGAQANS